MKKLIFILFALPCFCVSYADSTYDATKGALQNNSALCGYGYNPNCSSRNYPKKRIEYINVLVPSKFGALAHSLTNGVVAGSINMNSAKEAEKEAVAKCERDSRSTCEVLVRVKNGCLSAAVGKLKKGKYNEIVSPVAGEQGQVEQTALQKCKATGAKECKILIPEACSIP